MRSIAISILLSCVFFLKTQLSFAQELVFHWDSIPNQPWLAYNFWQNSLNDWSVEDNCVVGKPFYPNNRTAHITSHSISNSDSSLFIEFDIKLYEAVKNDSAAEFGILIGVGAPDLPQPTNNLIFKTLSPAPCHFFGIKSNGDIILKDFQKDSLIESFQLDSTQRAKIINELYNNGVTLSIGYKEKKKLIFNSSSGTNLTLKAASLMLSKFIINPIVKSPPKGNIALRYNSNTPYQKNVCFDNLKITGEGYTLNATNNGLIDPILSSFYTCTKDSLFFTAQLMPFKPDSNELFSLTIWPNNKSTYSYTGTFNSTSYQLRFRIKIPTGFKSFDYILKYRGNQSDIWTSKTGIIKTQPTRKKPRIMALNCNGFSFYTDHLLNYKNLLYPYRQIEKGFNKFKPDVVTFLGDQIYESRPEHPINSPEHQALDYIYKWNIWCYTFRNITKNQPTIILTDDHDVFQGNLWGNGGNRPILNQNEIPAYYGEHNYDTWMQDNGGYILGSEFANLVIKSQTSHLPFPHQPKPSNEIVNYYTSYEYGALNFAILEDKKFKSPPSKNSFEVYNGFALKDSLSPKDYNNPDLKLLGDDQLSFLTNWSENLRKRKAAKIILTQSAYVSLTTVPLNYSALKDKPVKRDSSKQKVSPDMDTNGWPKAGRDRALNALNQNNILFISGDQHLGAVIEVFDSSQTPFTFFSVPAITNTWPRMWWPSNEHQNKNHPLGDYTDAFGNELTVKAIANPTKNAPEPSDFNYKSPGFGIIDINKKGTKAKLKAYPLFFDQKKRSTMFPGWPVKVSLKN